MASSKKYVYERIQRFVLPSSEYKDLETVFPKILSDIMLGYEEEGEFRAILRLNVDDLKKNKKPQGYNPSEKPDRIRLLFPVKKKEDDPIEFQILYPTFRRSEDLSLSVEAALRNGEIRYELHNDTNYISKSREKIDENLIKPRTFF